MPIRTLHDLVDQSDAEGRTIKEVNTAKEHKFAIGQLVEIELGVRLLIARQVRDCDGTPLYHLSTCLPPEPDDKEEDWWNEFQTEQWEKLFSRHYPEYALKEVVNA